MTIEMSELDALQSAYRSAVEDWIRAIRDEEALASVDHSIAKLDLWEAAHFREEKARKRVIAAKSAYENSLRAVLFGF